MVNMKTNEEGMMSDTGNWNVADSFAKSKIMTPLDNCELYEDIAIYGFDSFFVELVNYGVPVEELKLRGIKRLNTELIKLAKNTRFAMKKPGTAEALKKLENALVKMRDYVLPNISSIITNNHQGTRTLKIDDKAFNLALEILTDIKSKMNTPLNQNHLIFTDREEFDPIAYKKRIKDRIINKG